MKNPTKLKTAYHAFAILVLFLVVGSLVQVKIVPARWHWYDIWIVVPIVACGVVGLRMARAGIGVIGLWGFGVLQTLIVIYLWEHHFQREFWLGDAEKVIRNWGIYTSVYATSFAIIIRYVASRTGPQ